MDFYHMKQLAFLLPVFLCIYLAFYTVTGCSLPMQYSFRNKLYKSPETAINAQNEFYRDNVLAIKPTENPLGGRVLCVLPARDLIEKKPIDKLVPYKPEEINYLISSFELELMAYADALEGRKIFDNVEIVKSSDPESVIISDYNLSIFCVVLGHYQAQWFLKSSSKNTRYQIFSDTSLPYGSPRFLSWLNNIEKVSKQIK
jgi:hypothetical protein